MKQLFWFSCLLICVIETATAQSYIYTPTDNDRSNKTERIIDLYADIKIRIDGTVTVTEYFTIYASGIDIRRGIARNIPEYRTDKNGKRKTIPVNILSLTHNGEKSEYHTETSYQSGGKEIILYTGSSNILLEKGIHQYVLVYETRGHIGFFDDYDELYWNVMGSDCVYSIENLSATVHLPEDSEVIQWACYTGVAGSTEQACECDSEKNAPTFTVTRDLQPNEGFSVSVAFPRNIIVRPAPLSAREQFWQDFRNRILCNIILLITAITQFCMWLKKGRDAKKQIVIPQFSPPNNWSPAETRHLYKRKFDSKAFTASLLQMAVKGGLGIEYRKNTKNKKKYYLISKDKEKLTNIEKTMYDNLFFVVTKRKDSEQEVLKEREVSSTSKHCLSGAAEKLKANVALYAPINKLYEKNDTCKMISLLLSITLWLAFMFMADLDSEDTGPIGVISLALLVMHPLFCLVIGARTEYGARTEAELAGLRMYLGTAEKHWLNQLTPPEQTPEHFEQMLPYAVALDVENEWCKKFHDVLKKFSYTPEWYSDNEFREDPLRGFFDTRMYSALNNSITQSGAYNKISNYISSASSSGGSSYSSGSSGDGYSGGGGGGGGVKGW